MDFEGGKKAENAGKAVGFVVMFVVFSTILYFLLNYLDKLPSSWGYFHLINTTATVVLLGILLRFWLKW